MDDKQKGASCWSRGIKGMLVSGEWGINEVEYSMFVWPLQQQCKQQLQRCLQHVAMTMTVDVWRRLANTHNSHTHTESTERRQTQHNAYQMLKWQQQHQRMHWENRSLITSKTNAQKCYSKQDRVSCNNFNSNNIVLQKGATLNYYFPPIFRSVHCGSGINWVGAEMREKWRSPPQDSYNKCHV